MSERVQFWIGIIITLLCLGVVLWIVDLGQVLAALRSANWPIAVLPVVACQNKNIPKPPRAAAGTSRT